MSKAAGYIVTVFMGSQQRCDLARIQILDRYAPAENFDSHILPFRPFFFHQALDPLQFEHGIERLLARFSLAPSRIPGESARQSVAFHADFLRRGSVSHLLSDLRPAEDLVDVGVGSLYRPVQSLRLTTVLRVFVRNLHPAPSPSRNLRGDVLDYELWGFCFIRCNPNVLTICVSCQI